MDDLQELKIKDGVLVLEDFEIKNLISYKLVKSSIDSPTELTMTLLVKDIDSDN